MLFDAVGSNVQLGSCTGDDSQRWMYDKTTGEIKELQSGLCIDVGSTASCQEQPWSGYPYCNTQLDPLTRAKDLVGRMEATEMVYKPVTQSYHCLFNKVILSR